MEKVKAMLFTFAATLLSGSTLAVEIPADAESRAHLYQREAREVLIHHGWHISRDEPHKIVADHPIGYVVGLGGVGSRMGLTDGDPERLGMFSVDKYAWLTLTFLPKSANRTDCAANLVAYNYDRTYGGKLSKPFPYNGPNSTKKIQGMMSEAEKQMTAQHPEYAKR